ncbi:MAG: tripartite tricarboxylate transporter substrate binding protein BugD [Alphaproteobacteria bacterium]|nr:tripartite tricarboxylate transporter substrate binding protein BugD [Alphaproteobacteria bacterium]
MNRITIALAFAALTGISGAPISAAQAQNYPARAVTVIVPFAAGGPADITGRIAADILSKQTGGQFVVENVGGAGGATGATRAARAAPDGYTLLLGHLGTQAASLALNPNLAYNPRTDFEAIGMVGEQPELLVVRQSLPPKTLKEFVAYAKANESKLNMAHAGVGSVSYTGCLLFNNAIGIKPTLVPFTGTAPVMNALLADQVDYVCDPILGPLPHVRAGKMKALAITSAQRHPALPDVPTSAEAGLPQFNITIFFGLFAPKGTPKPTVDRLAAALMTGLDDEAAQKRLTVLGASIPDKSRRGPAPLAALVNTEIERLTPILKAATGK